MKLIAMSDDAFCTFALFEVAGEEFFLNHYKARDSLNVATKDGDEVLDFTRGQCEDVLQELNKQRNYKRK